MRFCAAIVAACWLWALPGLAQTQSRPDFEIYRPIVGATRIDPDEAPTIDGDLSDPAWSRAGEITEFYQVEPIDGGEPSQPTRALFLYDNKTLYVAIYAYDSEPHLIRRSQLSRDPRLQDDDAVRILLDPYGTYRDAFFFGVNANGARSDALAENGQTFRDEWNAIWRARAQVVEDGWIAEFAIPFQSISFDASLDEWNMQIIRTIRRHDEEIRWSNVNQARGRIDMTQPGGLTEITDISSGIGLEAQLFATGNAIYDAEIDEIDFEFNPSGNLFYKITPSLTGSVTINTDFSDAPLDQRQVNTGRFSLFFPETRDFFLQDSAVFEFGGRVYRDFNNGLPFFSRNIGIVAGEPVDIIAGAKLSGKAGPANIGVISARTGDAELGGFDGQYLSAARASVPVLAESKAGIVFTHGDPTGEASNTLAGADFQYRKSNLLDDGTLFADFAYLRTFSDGVEDDMAGAEIAFRSQKWNGTFTFRDIGENYAPELGFVNRTGLRRYRQNLFRRFRPTDSLIRQWEVGAFSNLVTDLDDVRTDHFYGVWTEMRTNAGDFLFATAERGFEEIREPFEIAGVVPVAPGQYRTNQYEIFVESTSARSISAELGVRWGDVFDGDTLQINSGLTWRPSKHFEISGNHDYLDFSLPSGQIGIHIASIDSTIAFTANMQILTEIQYDNISEGFSFFSRFRWEPVPEREIFLSLGHSALIDAQTFPRDFRSQGTSLSLRYGQKLRF